MAAHARLSPSSAHRWMRCTGSVPLADALPPAPSSSYADEGTFCHEVAAHWIDTGVAPWVGVTRRVINGVEYVLTEEQHECIDTYVTNVCALAGGRQNVLTELSLPIEAITGEDGARGTADAIAVVRDELQVHDLKMGRGVEVEADGNEQLKLYALAALEALGGTVAVSVVHGFIHQPRLSRAPKVATWTPGELRDFGAEAARAAMAVHSGRTKLNPGEKQCRFCPARATCPALRAAVETAVDAGFDDLTEDDRLASAMDLAELAEQWARSVRAEVQRRLLTGRKVPGYKLVAGRKGARAWSNENQAADVLRAALGDAAYTRTLLSATAAEKALKQTDQRGVWDALVPFITQSPGSPTVVPASDRRPEISPGSASPDDFPTIEE